MKRSTFAASFAAALFAVLLAGCSSTTSLADKGGAPVESRNPLADVGGGTPADAAGTGGAPQSQVASVDLAGGESAARGDAALAKLAHTVYFDFDSFDLKDDSKSVIEGWAKVLAAKHAQHLTVEGYTDERGSSEYNLALGQKRAEAVTSALALLGVAAQQMQAVSFGKEDPADPGHDEAAWAKNRRAELKDR